MEDRIKTLSRPEIDDFLKSQKVGLLSLTDGQSAYSIPLGYSYDGENIGITIRNEGRKMAYINKNRNVCFVVYWIPEGFGMQKMAYKSVICDGKLEQVTDPEDITKAVRNSEKHMGLPEGAWNSLLEMTLKSPENSFFWRIRLTDVGGKSVEDAKK